MTTPTERGDVCEIIEGITLHHGDCRDIMRALPADHFDAIITDPPYGIAFKGGKWDTALAAAVESGRADHDWPVFRYQPKAPTRERPKVGGYSM